MIIFFLCFIRCIVCFNISLVILIWFFGILLKVEFIIFFLIECLMFVIFFGCLLIKSIISFVFGWFVVILCVIFFNRFVLLVFGGVIIKLCCLNLIGVIKFMMCVGNFFGFVFNFIWWFGYNGVNVGKCICFFVEFGLFLFIVLICNNLK